MNTTMTATGRDSGPLGLSEVLTGSLPATLLTVDAPTRYTVEAVFTRRVDRDEMAEISGERTHDALAAAGYPDVHLAVSDRRLEIGGTTLEELRDGLAATLMRALHDISDQISRRRIAVAGLAAEAAERERVRADAVRALAADVRFASAAPHRAGV